MSFNEIKELRHGGNLEAALQMANEALELAPTDIWNKRAAAWVHYDYLKKFAGAISFDGFKQHLQAINDLQLPEDEKMVFDNCAWQIGSMVFGLNRLEQVDYRKINELFEIIKDFHFTKPSEAYSFLYKAFLKGNNKWHQYIDFADWWGFGNFRTEDYASEELNGRKLMSVVERSYIAYAKRLLTKEQVVEHGFISLNTKPDGTKISQFIPRLDTVIEAHPEYQFLPYFKAKLMLEIGSGENEIESLLPFARKKRNEYWVWQLMAEMLSDDKEAQVACYCKALSLKTSEEFLVKIRQVFSAILIELKHYNEAKTEIEQVIAARNKEGWNTPQKVKDWTNQLWYTSAVSTKDNMRFYTERLDKAEDILYRGIPEETVVVEFVNTEKGILNFVKDKTKHGFFKYGRNLKAPKIGDFLNVRFDDDGQESGHFKVLSLKPTNPLYSEVIRSFEGKLKIIPQYNFGVVKEVFVPPNIVKGKGLIDGQHVKGRAMLSFNKKRNEWGWKAIVAS